MSVNSKMTAIANATRALDGSTAALTLDGIASKLGVEKTNIDAALAAIAEKEVDVPAGSTSAALASLIASIEAGGGATYASGSFTLDDDAQHYDIKHNLGEIPNIIIIVPEKPIVSSDKNQFGGCAIFVLDPEKTDGVIGMYSSVKAGNTASGTAGLYGVRYKNEGYLITGKSSTKGIPINSLTYRGLTAFAYYSNSSTSYTYFIAGVNYHWFVASGSMQEAETWFETVGGLA